MVFKNLFVNLRHPKFSIFGTTFFRPVPNTLFLTSDREEGNIKEKRSEKFSEIIILYKELSDPLFFFRVARYKLFQVLLWLRKQVIEKEKTSVYYTAITAPLFRRSVSMTTMVDRCSHTMRQKSFTVLAIGP